MISRPCASGPDWRTSYSLGPRVLVFSRATIRSLISAMGIGASARPIERTGSVRLDTPATILSSTGLGEGQSIGQSDSDSATRMRLPLLKRWAVKEHET